MDTSESIIINLNIINRIPPFVTSAENKHIMSIHDTLKIKNLIFSMKCNKALGPIGSRLTSFKSTRALFGEYTMNMLQHFFKSSFILKEMNPVFIFLIPKTESPTTPYAIPPKTCKFPIQYLLQYHI